MSAAGHVCMCHIVAVRMLLLHSKSSGCEHFKTISMLLLGPMRSSFDVAHRREQEGRMRSLTTWS